MERQQPDGPREGGHYILFSLNHRARHCFNSPFLPSVSQDSSRFNIQNKPRSFIFPRDFGGEQIENETSSEKYSEDKPVRWSHAAHQLKASHSDFNNLGTGRWLSWPSVCPVSMITRVWVPSTHVQNRAHMSATPVLERQRQADP